jgi:peptidoglycan/xylan/chitin deacetylase (PgdA/CDA1 family)
LPELIEYMLTKHPRFFFPAVALAPTDAARGVKLDYFIDSIREMGAFVEVRGWAVALGPPVRCGTLALCLDTVAGARSYATITQARIDLIPHFGPEAVNGGFVIYVPKADLKPDATPFHLVLDTGQRVLAARNAGAIRLNTGKRKHRAAPATEPSATILMYHRVTDLEDDPFHIAIRRDCFARQLAYLRRSRHVVPLGELLQDLAAGTLAAGTVALTFDDGYADNFHNALPLLEEHGLPATFCIAAGMIGRSREFWTDELERIVAQAARAHCNLHLTVAGKSYEFDCSHKRDDNLHALVKLLRIYPELVRDRLVRGLAAQTVEAPMRETHRPMSRTELDALARSPLTEFAAHSLTHPVLAAEDEERQREEIVESRNLLERLTGKAVTVFCYPFGQHCDFTNATLRLVREAGYQAALTSSPGGVRVGGDPFLLPRLHVQNWSPTTLARWLDEPPPTIAHRLG